MTGRSTATVASRRSNSSAKKTWRAEA